MSTMGTIVEFRREGAAVNPDDIRRIEREREKYIDKEKQTAAERKQAVERYMADAQAAFANLTKDNR